MFTDIPGNVPESSLLSDDHFLRKVANFHYYVGDTQERIAKKLNCSRQTVGKALQRARERGIVRIVVVPEERAGYLDNLARAVHFTKISAPKYEIFGKCYRQVSLQLLSKGMQWN
ncbi:MAG: helix-turn-helix domain-containing protein [Ktedonobacteraceae bacterium]|nr:helix-turn-helix domain-containing protein [Ktedonobacteraceae bacterium]